MAASGFTPISLYYSATASAVPLAANLVAGELALNTNDGKLYYKNSSSVVTLLASTAGSAGDVVGPASATANGIALFNSTTGKLIKDSAASDGLIYGLTVGRGAGAVSSNTAVGASALAANTSGSTNTAVGYQAMLANTTGFDSTAFGYQALSSVTTTNSNTAFGVASLKATTSGYANAAFGGGSLLLNTSGFWNNAFGQAALEENTSGAYNTAMGSQALNKNTTASNNTAVGYQAGYSNTTSGPVTVMGRQAGYSSNGGGAVAFFGDLAGYSTTTGLHNTGVGGYQTFYSNTTGSYNTALGSQALFSNTTASNNTAVGYQAGYGLTTGSSNTYIGYLATQSGVAVTNEIVVGANITGKGSDTAFIGGTSGAYNGANSTTWSIISDARLKKNVVSLELGLSVVSSLRPVEFDYIKDDKHDVGFIAQEYKKVLPKQITEDSNGMLSLSQNLVPYLVKAIQELKAEFDAYKATHP